MPTDPPGQTHECRECGCDAPSERQARRGRWTLPTVLPLLSTVLAAVVMVLAITPLRETLLGAYPSRPMPQQLRASLETALDQVYRSFELDEERATYDRIAQRVAGDAIRDVYLEVRRSLLAEDGGRVSIDDVRVEKVDGVQWQFDGGCQLDATWVVRGTVGHFGHQHERQNRYRARINMLSQNGAWKIRSILMTEQEREK